MISEVAALDPEALTEGGSPVPDLALGAEGCDDSAEDRRPARSPPLPPPPHAARTRATAPATGARLARNRPPRDMEAIVRAARTMPDVSLLTPACVWRATPGLVMALDDRFGEPVDAYVNGSQVWLREDGPNLLVIEWRLHPVPGYQRPRGVDTYSVFADTAQAFTTGTEPPAPLDRLWEGLEAFPAYGDEIEPAILAAAVTEALGVPPDAWGLADHVRIGDAWERSGGTLSIVDALLGQLAPGS